MYTHTHTISNPTCPESREANAVIRGTEYGDYALFLSSALSLFLSSVFQHGCRSLLSLFSSLSSKTLSAVDEALQVRWKRSTSMKSLYTHTHTHRNIPTLPGSEQNHTTEKEKKKKKEANGETVTQNAEGSSFIPPLHPFKFQILSVVSPLSAFCPSSLISDPPRRIAAVKLLTSSSASVTTLNSALNSPRVPVRVCA